MDRSSSNPPPIPGPPRVQRARSLPAASPFRVSASLFAMHYLGLIAAVTALVSFAREPCQPASRIILGGLALSAIFWLIAFFKRRATFCPLCKGTPLINSGARTHVRARRILPFNHGTTAILSILATQKFRCMYCGSDFDLLKPPTRLLHGSDHAASHDRRS